MTQSPRPSLHDVLTEGYGRALELEAEHRVTGRRIDDLLARGEEGDEVLALVRHQRALGSEIAALRARLGELDARRRLRREA